MRITLTTLVFILNFKATGGFRDQLRLFFLVNALATNGRLNEHQAIFTTQTLGVTSL